MTIDEFIKGIAARFPTKAATVTQWASDYAITLARVPQDDLQGLFNTVMHGWDKSVPPLPAVFAREIALRAPKPVSGMYGNSFWHRVRVRARNMVNRFEAGLATTLEIEHRAHILWIYKDKAFVLAQQIEVGRFPDGTEVVMTEADYDNARDRFTSQRDNYARFAKRGLAGFKTLSATP